MRHELLVLGPPYLDLSFHGLGQLPGPGEEVFARGVEWGPGGAAISAIAAARLGLPVGLVWPVGDDPPGRLLANALGAEGVDWRGPSCAATAVSAVIVLDGDRAIVSHAPEVSFTELRDEAEEALSGAGAAIVSMEWAPELTRIRREPTKLYAVMDDQGSRRHSLDDLSRLAGAYALVLNRDEAGRLTGTDDPEAAARMLLDAAQVEVVLISLGADGALARAAGTEPIRAVSPRVPVVDSTGAGDVFVAAYAWAELGGLAPAERLAVGCVAAGLSLGRAGGAAGAPTLPELTRAARTRGLALPARP